ncbi:MAG: DUF6527 family protein [Steroidobacteraceae bacterium]
MRREIAYQFVDLIPDEPAEGILYVSMACAKAVHRCCCGCGAVVATPLGRGGWKLEFDGVSVSLKPPIDDWTVPCGSHYRIRRNRVKWLSRWSQLAVETGRYSSR